MSSAHWNRRRDTFFPGEVKHDQKRGGVNRSPAGLLVERVAESSVACITRNEKQLTVVGDAVLSALRGDESVTSAYDVIVKAEARRRA